MELGLQFGYGMMDHSRSLVDAWGGGTAILSPRDLSPSQLERLSGEITGLKGGEVLVDPQFYLPHADHARLVSHDYWPKQYRTSNFWTGAELRELLTKLHELNTRLGTKAFILPGLYASRVDDDWLDPQKLVIEEARALSRLPIYATVALSADAVRSNNDVDEVLNASASWAVDGVYLVCEHPAGEYLVTDPIWMTNVLDLTAGLRLQGKAVVVGYCNHQMLALSCVSATAIASGTWMNVRSFPPDKFRTQYDDEIRQRATWYYCPQALSEYKISFLDIAQRQGILPEMAPDAALDSKFAAPLFAGAQPTSVSWSEQSAFRHYLQCLHEQASASRRSSFDDTVAEHNRALDRAAKLLTRLHEKSVRGQGRDFLEAIDANRAALSVVQSTRGPMLRRKWTSLDP